ncbi:MAG: hypothetical protein ACO3CQ_01855 [Candidatus Nanopelagicaceae bacterium]|jgi:hypothetical protein
MFNLEIPDPFEAFVSNKYRSYKGAVYNFFSREWHMKCGCCGEDLYAPNKKDLKNTRLYHTRNICLGGY